MMKHLEIDEDIRELQIEYMHKKTDYHIQVAVVLLGIFIINIMPLISKDGEEMEFCNTMKQILKKM